MENAKARRCEGRESAGRKNHRDTENIERHGGEISKCFGEAERLARAETAREKF
jgi:hypothetical protein